MHSPVSGIRSEVTTRSRLLRSVAAVGLVVIGLVVPVSPASAAPQNINAPYSFVSTAGPGEISMSWNDPLQTGADGGYVVQVRTASDGVSPPGPWTNAGGTCASLPDGAARGCVATGLTPGVGYDTRIAAITGGQQSHWNTRLERYARHTFTSDGTFEITAGTAIVDYLVVGGGGGGGGGGYRNASSGGGGAGGGGAAVLYDSVELGVGTYAVVVGTGGAGGAASGGVSWTGSSGGNGGTSSFGAISAPGGKGGFGGGSNATGGHTDGAGGGKGGDSGNGNLGGVRTQNDDNYAAGAGGAGAQTNGTAAINILGGSGGLGRYPSVMYSGFAGGGGGGGASKEDSRGGGSGDAGDGGSYGNAGEDGRWGGNGGGGGAGSGEAGNNARAGGSGGIGRVELRYDLGTGVTATGGSSGLTNGNAVTPYGPPLAPETVTGTSGDGQIAVAWSEADNQGATITGYTVTASPGGRTCTTSGNPAGTSCAVTGLTNGIAYTFTVTSTNSEGTSSASESSLAVVPMTAPGSPTSVSATPNGKSASVTWTAPASSGANAPETYEVTASPGGATCTVDVPTTTCDVEGLINGTSYTFAVTASNGAGTSAPSTASTAVTPVAEPDAPTNVTGTDGDSTSEIAWTAPEETGGLALSGYSVESRVRPDGSWQSAEGCSSATESTDVSCTATGLVNGAAYEFRVAAINSLGTGSVSAASAEVTPYGVPLAPVASATPSSTAVAVSWSEPADEGREITAYTVTATPGGESCSITDAPLARECTLTGLTNGQSYSIAVVATNARGDGPAGVVDAIPATIPGAPTDVEVSARDAAALVSWTPPADDGGSAVTSYTVTEIDGSGTCVVEAPATSCLVQPITNGVGHTFAVSATNVMGDGEASEASAAVVPAPVDITLTLKFGVGADISAGDGLVTLGGSGLQPDSDYTVTLRSSPVVIAQGTTSALGVLTADAVIPSNTEPGNHSITLDAVAADGSAASAVAYFSIEYDGTVGGTSYDSESELPAPKLNPDGESGAAANDADNRQGQSGSNPTSLAYTGSSAGMTPLFAFALIALGWAVLQANVKRRNQTVRA